MDQDRVRRTPRRASDAWRHRIGSALRQARLNRRLTQAQLAGQAGLDLMTVSKIERGVTVPDLATLWALADMLGYSLDALVGREPSADRTATADATAGREATLLGRLELLERTVAGLEPGDLVTVSETARKALALALRHEDELSPRRKRRAAK